MSDDRPIIQISPEPSAEELAAIMAAVSAALFTPKEVEQPEPVSSRWVRAARDEALRVRQDAWTKTS